MNFEDPSLVEFLSILDEYFPAIHFDTPISYIKERLDRIPNLPASIVTGKYNKIALTRFLKESGLMNLHDLFEKQQFQDLLYDIDLRKRIDGMSLSGFRPLEIEQEIHEHIQDINTVFTKTYLECFSDFREFDYAEKNSFIIHSYEDKHEQLTLLRCIATKSRDTVRTLLGVCTKNYNHIELINRIAQIAVMKTEEGLIEDNDIKLQAYLKLGIKVSESLHSFGVGNKDAADALLAALAKTPEDQDKLNPPQMTVTDLEALFTNQHAPEV